MSYAKNTAALAISLVSIVVALRIDAQAPGVTGSVAIATPAHTLSTTAPVHREAAPVVTEPAEVEVRTETTIEAETEELREMAERALSRFDKAGLELPVLTIYAFSDKAGCGDNFGYFSIDHVGNYEIHICGVDFTMLHELGHAWAKYNLTEEKKQQFLDEDYAAADEWRVDGDWLNSGSEHCANVIAWGLMEDRVNQTRTRPYDHGSMLKAFDFLTDGGEPLWMSA
ncbi:MAG: hypothetical protein QNJ75_07670 [Acidimicrobiia bacterium]|nr:hypothetical protein [Acidimicrobiia bacterium]